MADRKDPNSKIQNENGGEGICVRIYRTPLSFEHYEHHTVLCLTLLPSFFLSFPYINRFRALKSKTLIQRLEDYLGKANSFRATAGSHF
jgi:hypothetical protein